METLRKIDRTVAVKQEAGTLGSSRWSNKDLDPVPANQRTWTAMDVASYWNSDQMAPATWDLGSTMVGLGLCAREAIPLSFVAFFVIGIVLTLNGRIGATTHCSLPVVIRASFGMWGSYLAVLVRAVLAALWLFVLTFQGGRIVAVMTGAVWPTFLKIPNTLPPNLGIDTQTIIGFAILWIFQAPLACVPVRRLAFFFRIKAYTSYILFGGLFVWAMVVTKGKGFILTGQFDEKLLPQGSKSWAMIAGLNAVTGLYSTVSINIPDFSRFAKSPKASWAQLVAVPVFGCIPIAISICCAAAAEQQFGQQVFDPASLCSLFSSRAARFFAGLGWFVASVGVNLSANSISFATDITSVMPRYLSIFRCSVLAGILCWATNPWRIVTDAPQFYSFLSSYPVFLAPVATILATDFYIIRKGKVDVRQYYDPEGIYRYFYGVNLRAVVAWIFALAPNLPAFAHAVNPMNPNPQPYTYYLSWYMSTFGAFVWYLFFNALFPPHSSFVDEAVYEVGTIEYSESTVVSNAEKGEGDAEKEFVAGVVAV
ncbi:NCS1 allantoate transporter [Rhodotorula toruloides]|uniref:NCS1 allantoate transporter n=1 Tax=Rhodotorula toruloides TaxID=5286 RepID=A0A511KLX9_RHOTO|nr:NCS1 allantoate transporter [Rhodotorula toruloides]